jgi:hypothetical protein
MSRRGGVSGGVPGGHGRGMGPRPAEKGGHEKCRPLRGPKVRPAAPGGPDLGSAALRPAQCPPAPRGAAGLADGVGGRLTGAVLTAAGAAEPGRPAEGAVTDPP